MAKPYPQHPNLSGAFAPVRMECDVFDLVVEGELPRDLHGSLYRIGPNPQFAPRGFYHWFGGDGMVHAFHVENGRVCYRNRWVRTEKFRRERDAGRALFSPFNPLETDPSVQGVQTDGLANTNIVWHSGRLLALEEAHAPFQMDPVTLESQGAWRFDGRLAGPMTAHPKMDPETGEMVFFGYNTDGMLSAKMAYHETDRDGRLIHSRFFDAPYASMVHDFVVTRDHVVFPIMPLTGSMERAMNGQPAFAWEPDKGTWLGVMPRKGEPDDIRWFRGEAAYMFHPMNAWSEGGRIVCDVCQYEEAPLFPHADGSAPDRDKANAHLTRWVIDLASDSDSYQVQRLHELPCEFPRFDERFAGLPYRYGWMGCAGRETSRTGSFSALAAVDHASGALEMCDLGAGCAVSEPVFVPRSAAAAEGDGYLLATVYDADCNSSHLAVFDAQNVAAGPLARAMLDHRVPLGFHGNWVDGVAGWADR